MRRRWEINRPRETGAVSLHGERGVSLGQVLSLETSLVWRNQQRLAGRTVVMTNGHFDLLHVGHVRYLEGARRLGDALVVGLNSDASTRARKPGRPLVPQEDRAELLAALGCVDAVVIFDDLSANALVAALRPEIYVKGGDWGQSGGPQPPEAEIVSSYGGRVVYLPYVPDHSTTRLIERIRALSDS
jgi:rfaE bifunctional protein nucleotidyltransferase chain/domain